MHTPVLLQNVIEELNPKEGRTYIDATFGAGGHASAIASRGAKVLALDADCENVASKQSEATAKGIVLICSNYANIEKVATENKFIPCEGVLFDLGLSMEQIGEKHKGFSYKNDTDPLDMRLNNDQELTARDIVKNYSEEELYETLVTGAEEINSRAIVQSITRARRIKTIDTVVDLNKAIELGVLARGPQFEKILRRVYQALFIEVNDEFGNLKLGLKGALNTIVESGKIVVISFHAGHERIVKKFAKQNVLKMKVIRGKNVGSFRFERSATMRVLTKI